MDNQHQYHNQELYRFIRGWSHIIYSLYIKKLLVRDFRSFYGEHVFTLGKGVSIITYADRQHRTDFCKAIEFALYGGINYISSEYSELVNKKRLSECGNYDWLGCQVDLKIMRGSDEYLFSRTYEPFPSDNGREKFTYSTLAPKLNHANFHEFVYLSDGFSELNLGNVEGSRGFLMLKNLEEVICRNLNREYSFIILDHVLSRFTDENLEIALNLLEESRLNQVIIVDQRSVGQLLNIHKTVHTYISE